MNKWKNKSTKKIIYLDNLKMVQSQAMKISIHKSLPQI